MSLPGRVATATSLSSRLTTTSSVAGFLRKVFSMPCAQNAQTTTQLPLWDFTNTGSPLIGGRRVSDIARLDAALTEALEFDGCFVVDVQIDRSVLPPFDERVQSVASLFSGEGT